MQRRFWMSEPDVDLAWDWDMADRLAPPSGWAKPHSRFSKRTGLGVGRFFQSPYRIR
jgi:hypothetical protein